MYTTVQKYKSGEYEIGIAVSNFGKGNFMIKF